MKTVLQIFSNLFSKIYIIELLLTTHWNAAKNLLGYIEISNPYSAGNIGLSPLHPPPSGGSPGQAAIPKYTLQVIQTENSTVQNQLL